MRQEVRRFVYMCDGMEQVHKRCPSTQVVDAVDEKEADQIARMRGWRIESGKPILCGNREHKKYARKVSA